MSTWFFDLIAPFYDRVATSFGVCDPERAYALLELEGHERILDVGGGTGALARLVVERKRCRVTVLDSSRKMLDQLPDHPRIQPVHGLANSLPFHAETFDWVVCTAAFHWMTPHQATLAAMRRVLKPQGRLLLQDFSRTGLAGPWLAKSEELLKQGAEYLSPAQLEALLIEQGFTGRFIPFNLLQYAFIGGKQG